jgi:hypothetical protein
VVAHYRLRIILKRTFHCEVSSLIRADGDRKGGFKAPSVTDVANRGITVRKE